MEPKRRYLVFENQSFNGANVMLLLLPLLNRQIIVICWRILSRFFEP